MEPWYDLDDFWETTAPFMFDRERWAAAHAEVDQILILLGLASGADLLDLCCGPGRHSLELARRGFRVTGLDRTAAHLEMARLQAHSEGLAVEFIQEDMRRFCRPEAFDGVINLFTSFGYFDDPADDRQVLQQVYRSLKQEGVLVMDLVGKEALARNFRERDWISLDEEHKTILLRSQKITRDWSWLEGRWILFNGDSRHEFTYSHRIYSAAELSALLRECGFRAIEIYGDLTASLYDALAKRLIAVAHK